MSETTPSLVEQTQYTDKEDLAPQGQYLARLIGAEAYEVSKEPNLFYFFFRFEDPKTKKNHLAGIILSTGGKDKRFDEMLNAMGISHHMFRIVKLSSIMNSRVLIRISHGETKDQRFYHRAEGFAPVPRLRVQFKGGMKT